MFSLSFSGGANQPPSHPCFCRRRGSVFSSQRSKQGFVYRNRRYHIRLMPSVEKQNWAHRLYDHARAREGSEEGIDLEVAGPMSTLGTFGQEELLKDVHHIILVARIDPKRCIWLGVIYFS